MTQPSGRICNSSSGIGHLIRISPIMCALDALSILISILVYSITKKSFRSASVEVITQRFASHDDNSGSFSDFKKNTFFRWFIFAFSMSQVVKLYAFQGLPWTKVWASMYLGSFFIAELLVIVPNRWLDITPQNKPGDDEIPSHSRETDDDRVPQGSQSASDKRIPLGTGGTSLPYLSITVCVLFILYFTVHAITSISENYNWSLNSLESTGMVLLVCGSPPFVSSSVHSYFLRTNKNNLSFSLEILLLLAILAVPTAYYLLSHVLPLEQKDISMLSPIATTMVVPVMIGT